MYRRRNYYRPRNRRNRWRSRSPERQGEFGEFERDRRENYQIEDDSDAIRSDRTRNLRELNDLYSNHHNNTSGNLFSTPSSHQISQSPISYFPNLMDNTIRVNPYFSGGSRQMDSPIQNDNQNSVRGNISGFQFLQNYDQNRNNLQNNFQNQIPYNTINNLTPEHFIHPSRLGNHSMFNQGQEKNNQTVQTQNALNNISQNNIQQLNNMIPSVNRNLILAPVEDMHYLVWHRMMRASLQALGAFSKLEI